MASIDTLVAAIHEALARIHNLAAHITASKDLGQELRHRLTELGAKSKVAQASAIIAGLEENHARTNGMAAQLEAALAATEAMRTGQSRTSAESPRSAPTPQALEPPGESIQPGPDLARAEFDDRKLTKYALNPEHPVGGNKARVIKSRTGLGLDDAAEVKRQILEKAPTAEPIMGDTDEHGTRWKVDVDLTGPDGTMKVRTAWIADAAGKTRLVTISFPPKGER